MSCAWVPRRTLMTRCSFHSGPISGTQRPKRSFVRSRSRIGFPRFGSPHARRRAASVIVPPIKTPPSNVIGMKAGSETIGFPPTLRGQSIAEVQISKKRARHAPVSPITSVTHGTHDFFTPSASLMPCTAYGVYASRSANPCSRARVAAWRSLSGSSYRASTPRVGVGFRWNGLRMDGLLRHRHSFLAGGHLLRAPEHALHFGDGDGREESAEEEEPHEEEPERAHDDRVVEDRGLVVRPRRREEVAVERGHDEREPLEPHPHVDQDRHDEHDR